MPDYLTADDVYSRSQYEQEKRESHWAMPKDISRFSRSPVF